MRKHSQELPFLLELQHQQNDIAKIKQQRQLISKVQSTIAKKDEEITALKTLLEKYHTYQQKYSSLKIEVTEKTQVISRKDAECKLLRRQFEELVSETKQTTARSKQLQHQKLQLQRQRQQIERTSKETERLFKEYQGECRRREQQLSQQLQRAYHKHKEQNAKIDQLQTQVQAIPALQAQLAHLEQLPQHHAKERTPLRPNFTETEDISSELMRLQQQLLRKEQELTSQRMLNYELTLDYNQVVSSLCGLQTEISSYRRENVELKQTLSQMREQQNTMRMQQRYRGSRIANRIPKDSQSGSKQSGVQSEEQSEQESELQNKCQLISTQS